MIFHESLGRMWSDGVRDPRLLQPPPARGEDHLHGEAKKISKSAGVISYIYIYTHINTVDLSYIIIL